MQRRKLLKTSIASSSMFCVRGWKAPLVIAVTLPAHATTSETLYSGIDSSPSSYAALRNWKGVATKNADSSVSVTVQNTDNTIRIGAIIDEIGPASPGQIRTSCIDISSEVDAGITVISDREITIGIMVHVLGLVEEITITLPMTVNQISFPPIEPACTLR